MSTTHSTIDCLVVGAGVIGLAVARALASAGHTVVIAERECAIGTGISARSSEVIHAGIYYPHNSLKARSCVAGNALLYAFCAAHGVPHRRCGKLIVATDNAQLPALEQLARTGISNGVALQWLERAQARSIEPQLQCVAALHSPDTGIVDTRQFMLALLGDAERHGATLALATPIARAERDGDAFTIFIGEQPEPALRARWLINCGGLGAIALAHCISPLPADLPVLYLAKGSYFSLQGRSPFSRLIYPLPESGGLGVHLTLDLGGQARFGPDVEWVETCDYQVDSARAENFYTAIRRYWPALRDGQLQSAYAGIRPKLGNAATPAADFRVDGPLQHGVPGLIQLFGIESPGITASLALAAHVETMMATLPH